MFFYPAPKPSPSHPISLIDLEGVYRSKREATLQSQELSPHTGNALYEDRKIRVWAAVT